MASRTQDEIMDLHVWTSRSLHQGDKQTGEDDQIDIIAVQGLGANPYYTWVKKVPGKRDSTMTEEVMWLRDLLPSYIKNARIATFSYLSGWYAYKKGIKTSLRELGGKLLNALQLDRQKLNAARRPIIFIGHSMGGLVIKQALVLASNRPSCEDIKLSTTGIIFLGTPHGGTDIAGYGAFIAMLKQNDSVLLESMRPTDQELWALSIDFAAGYKHLSIMCFYEKLPVEYAGGLVKVEVVHQHSAVREGSDMMYLLTDHSGLNKFWGHDDPNFKIVCAVIEGMAKDAPRIVKQNYYGPSQTRATHLPDAVKQEMLRWFSPLDFGIKQEDIFERRHKGSGEWFLQHVYFRSWLERLDTSDRILWCPGIPGSGKTFLCSIVVDFLVQRKNRLQENFGIAHMYCNYKELQNQTAEKMVSRLLQQLLQQIGGIPKYVEELYEDHMKAEMRLGREEGLAMLRTIAASFARVFIVIDALDECDPAILNGFIRPLIKLSDICILVTSRDLPYIERCFASSRRLEIRANDADIRSYVQDRIDGEVELADFVNEDDTLREKIMGTLVQRSCGMFLLTELHIKSLIELDNPKAVLQALDRLPIELDASYDDAISRIERQPEQHRTRAKQVLSWISFTLRPLTVAELRQALAVELGSRDLDESGLPALTRLISVCAGLVAVDRQSQIIRLVHETTQIYFERNRLKLFPGAQQEISKTCLTYLSFDVFAKGPCSTDEEMDSRLHELPFFDYAARYWGDHVRESEDESVQHLTLQLLEDNAKLMSSVQRWCYPTILGREYTQRFPKALSGIHVASAFGLEMTILDLLKNGANINVNDETGWTPLTWAVSKGYISTVRLFLENGADDLLGDKSGRLPIHHAAQRGYKHIAELLAKRHSNLNQKNKLGETPLQLAALEGHLEVVQFLLTENATVDLLDKKGRTALHRSVQGQHSDIVGVLLSRNANPIQPDYRGETAMHAGAMEGNTENFQLLLTAFKSIPPAMGSKSLENPAIAGLPLKDLEELRDKKGRTLLHVASIEGHTDIVKLLLMELVNIELTDKNGWTALDWAVENGHLGVVEIFWQAKNSNSDNHLKRMKYLQRTAGKGDEKMVAYWLKQGEEIDSHNSDDRRTALHFAAIKGRTNVALMLLESGADPNIRDRNGLTPIQSAALWRQEDFVLSLLKRSKFDLNQADDRKRTLLHWVALRGWSELVARMLEMQASPVAQDEKGHTPLHAATINNETKAAQILADDGRSVLVRDKDGWLASDWALWLGSSPAVSILRSSDETQTNRSKRLDLIYQRINIGLSQLEGDGPGNHSDNETFLCLGKSAAFLGRLDLALQLLIEHSRRYPSWICGFCRKPRKVPQQRNHCSVCFDGDACKVCMESSTVSLCHEQTAFIRVDFEGSSHGQSNAFWVAALKRALEAEDLNNVVAL